MTYNKDKGTSVGFTDLNGNSKTIIATDGEKFNWDSERLNLNFQEEPLEVHKPKYNISSLKSFLSNLIICILGLIVLNLTNAPNYAYFIFGSLESAVYYLILQKNKKP